MAESWGNVPETQGWWVNNDEHKTRGILGMMDGFKHINQGHPSEVACG